MTLSTQRLGFYAGAAVAFFFAIGAASASLLATLLFAAAGLVALPQVRGALRDRGTVITTWLAAALLVTGLIAGIGVYSIAEPTTSPNTQGASNSPTTPTANAPSINLAANDTAYENPADSLHVGWNGTARSAVDPQRDDGYTYEADSGKQYVIVRLNLTNTGERSLDLTPEYFRLLAAGVEYAPQQLVGGDDLRSATLRPGASYQAHLAFEIPADVDAAVVITNPDAYYNKQVAANFTRNSGLAIQYA